MARTAGSGWAAFWVGTAVRSSELSSRTRAPVRADSSTTLRVMSPRMTVSSEAGSKGILKGVSQRPAEGMRQVITQTAY